MISKSILTCTDTNGWIALRLIAFPTLKRFTTASMLSPMFRQRFWFEEISATFPDSKVILTVRDSEEAWLKSWKEHLELGPFYFRIVFAIVPLLGKKIHFFDTLHQAIYGSFNPEATALYRVKYRQHNERVQAIIPAEKLLVFNVKQGWQLLCDFLGCDAPSTPFPRANVAHSDTKSKISQTFMTDTFVFVFLLIVFLLAAFFVAHIMA
ncbi:hypothetical protein OS493_004366 [Desmophyllum pertusum]|uniref:Sulfotransferase n=1 Tax=Desmophyllum pertusum TaxID=174260 RepID=A0A9X0D4U2_9CNID|nr:hypothetical protein OS493_004366 [Desmophyllum pertusum]